jgi:tRNA threonylcarbamoyladenosine biosynthesis protein TsaE
MAFTTHSPEETKELAFDFVKALRKGEQATVIALSGDLGSGKTTFSQYIGEALGVREAILSPTFIIEKIYELYKQPWQHLIHIDAYRLGDPQELVNLGWQQIVSKPENIILIEWADKVESILPENAIRISFKGVDETTREIDFNA